MNPYLPIDKQNIDDIDTDDENEQEKHDNYYGFFKTMTPQERRAREQQIERSIIASGGELNDEPSTTRYNN